MSNAIAVSGANKRYGDFVALDNVDFAVPAGSLTALLGPSGSGKSTLLRAIAGLDHPDSGTVTINGVDVTGIPPQRRGIGFVFQHYAAFKHLSVARNVAFGLEIRKRPKPEIKKKVDELLALVHLTQFADRLPSQLSGGQRQGMALARALAVEPAVLLMDEPLSNLDALLRLEMRAELKGVLAEVASILSARGINIESIMQKEAEEHDGLVPMILVTHRVREAQIDEAIAALEALEGVAGKVVRIRVEQLN